MASTVTYTGRRECMHKGRDDLPENLAEHEVGDGRDGGENLRDVLVSRKRRERRNVCSFCYLYEVSTSMFLPPPPPLLSAFVPESTEFAVSDYDVMLH